MIVVHAADAALVVMSVLVVIDLFQAPAEATEKFQMAEQCVSVRVQQRTGVGPEDVLGPCCEAVCHHSQAVTHGMDCVPGPSRVLAHLQLPHALLRQLHDTAGYQLQKPRCTLQAQKASVHV